MRWGDRFSGRPTWFPPGQPGSCVSFADYRGNGRRVVVLPLTTGTGPGRSVVNIVGFAAFFISELPGNLGDAIEAEYLHRVAIPR